MVARSLVSREVVVRIRDEQIQLLRTIDQLRRVAEIKGTTQLADRITALREGLRDHASLVSAVLDAVSEDTPERPS